MKIIKTKISELVIIKSKKHRDARGFFREIYQEKVLKKKFVFDCFSTSKKDVLRGLHFQAKNPQGKLISVLHGEIFDVAVDLRPTSKTFGKYFSIKINEKSDFSIYIPPKFAHGFLCLSKYCKIYYKCTNYRNKSSEKSLLWNDNKVGIKWPKRKVILSKKDLAAFTFDELNL